MLTDVVVAVTVLVLNSTVVDVIVVKVVVGVSRHVQTSLTAVEALEMKLGSKPSGVGVGSGNEDGGADDEIGTIEMGVMMMPDETKGPGTSAKPGLMTEPGKSVKQVLKMELGMSVKLVPRMGPGMNAQPESKNEPGLRRRPGMSARQELMKELGMNEKPGLTREPGKATGAQMSEPDKMMMRPDQMKSVDKTRE
ncbi:hypothetical protein ONZ43_g1060 [Nemania bipapillata]|uniref:Uncharacterized protein n=1 Tax=Nemania bipapillata TaxID=110536 RepID=A0ACC2J5Y9_9PEZI|nr:hypothetical protein ONZ43_g1060 [Nemania bipapillata]